MDVLNTFMLIVLLFEIFITGRPQSVCRPPGPDGIPVCCQYYYIAGNYCKECPTGFRVLSSDYNCDFPSYGDHCKETCSCSKEDCNHVYGCPEISTNEETTTYTFLKTEGISRDKNILLSNSRIIKKNT